MKTQTVWKVVRRHNKKLFSFIQIKDAKLHPDRMHVRYLTTKPTRPPKGKSPFLFCFSTFEAAKAFRNVSYSPSKMVVYEAVAKNVVDTDDGNYHYPPGTMLADEIQLVRRVKH